MMKRSTALLALALFGLWGCGDDDKGHLEDAAVDGDEFPVIERSEPGPGQGTDGPDPATPLTAGARLGRYRGGAPLITGPEARCREGDFILQNAILTACISDGPPADQMHFTAGRIIDLVPTNDPTGDTLDFIGPALGLLEASTDELAILRDGSDGGPAVLRSTGVDLPLKLLVGSLGTSLLTPSIHVRVETEFRLGPEATALEVVTWVNLEGGRAAALLLGDLAFPGDLNRVFTWPHGFDIPGANESMEAAAFVGRERSYGYVSESIDTPPLDPSVLSDSIFGLITLSGQLGSVFEAASRRYITVGDGTTTSLRENLPGLIPDSTRHTVLVEGTFDETFAGGRWAIFHEDGTAIDVVRVDPSTSALELPAGNLHAELIDAPWPGASVDFTVPAAETVAFPSPDAVAVTVHCQRQNAEGTFTQAPACRVDYSGSLSGTSFQRASEPLLLPRGFTGTLRMSLGETHAYAEEDIDDLQSAQAIDVDLELELDTSGWAAGDLHQHAMRSADSTVPSEARALANLAAGLDFLAPSDHDIVEDYPRVLEAMGLAGSIHVFQGVEISPVRGHINVFPAKYGPTHAGGAPALAVREGLRSGRQRNTNELLADARGHGAQVVQINHARSETSSLLDWVDYDPVSGEARRRFEDMPEQFEAMEIFNTPRALCTLMRDWFSFHRHGLGIVGFGNSDTHSLGAPSGYPRNYVHVGASEVNDDSLVAGILAGRVLVSGGLIVDFGDTTLPGDVIEVAAGATTASVPVRVRSPAWAKADELIVYVNGVEQERIDLRAETELADLLDYEAEIEVNVSGDAFVVVFAYADDTMSVVTPGRRPFGFTNPVFIDVGGDGWTPPGAQSLDDVPIPVGIPFCPDESSTGRRVPFDTFEAMQVDPWTTLDHRPHD
jgi:hypothetical protein